MSSSRRIALLTFDGVAYTYGSSEVPALSGISFDLPAGEMLAVVGANGSGKSTLVRLANGLLLPSFGSVMVDGTDTRDARRRREVRTSVGVVFQRPEDQIVATSVEDDVAFGPENLGLSREEIRTRTSEAIRAVGLEGFERREPHLLSGGQKQRLAIAGALAMRARHLVLDEPTSMIDPNGRAEVLSLLDHLRSAGHAILHVTHDLSEAMRADRVLVLARGEIAYLGSPHGAAAELLESRKWGIEPTPLMRLASALTAQGLHVPVSAVSAADVAEALWA